MLENCLHNRDGVILPLRDPGMRPCPVDTIDGQSMIRVSRCQSCHRDYWPERPICLQCGSSQFAPAHLAGRGKLYAFSLVHVSSSRETPYTIGYVDLSPGLRVLADIVQAPDLACDQMVRLVPGTDRLCFAPEQVPA